MCGLFGYFGMDAITLSSFIDRLSGLEYRGYDSCGIAWFSGDQDASVHRMRAVGPVKKLQQHDLYKAHHEDRCTLIIGHTRWASHGHVVEKNAHPFTDGQGLYLVHNGVIENFVALKKSLEKVGDVTWTSGTDTEVIVHLIRQKKNSGLSTRDAFQATCEMLEGHYALLLIDEKTPNTLYAVSNESPLLIGGDLQGNHWFSSDVSSLRHCYAIASFEEREVHEVSLQDLSTIEKNNQERQTKKKTVKNQYGQNVGALFERKPANWPNATELTTFALDVDHDLRVHIAPMLCWFQNPRYTEDPDYFRSRDPYTDLTLDEIGQSIDMLERSVLEFDVYANLPVISFVEIMSKSTRVIVFACGSSYYLGLFFKYWFNKYMSIPIEVYIASDYDDSFISTAEAVCVLMISQSGETMDVINAAKRLKTKRKDQYDDHYVYLGNQPHSKLATMANTIINTRCGFERAVATTKVFTITQFIILVMLKRCSFEFRGHFLRSQTCLYAAQEGYKHKPIIEELVKSELSTVEQIFFFGRGMGYILAQEAALKVKELSYVHAEAFSSGEMKHGPLALIQPNVSKCVFFLGPTDEDFKMQLSSLQELLTRGAMVFLVGDKNHVDKAYDSVDFLERIHVRKVAGGHQLSAVSYPFFVTIVLQLFAYYMGKVRGIEVDQPRNLAKSVTVS